MKSIHSTIVVYKNIQLVKAKQVVHISQSYNCCLPLRSCGITQPSEQLFAFSGQLGWWWRASIPDSPYPTEEVVLVDGCGELASQPHVEPDNSSLLGVWRWTSDRDEGELSSPTDAGPMLQQEKTPLNPAPDSTNGTSPFYLKLINRWLPCSVCFGINCFSFFWQMY